MVAFRMIESTSATPNIAMCLHVFRGTVLLNFSYGLDVAPGLKVACAVVAVGVAHVETDATEHAVVVVLAGMA